MYDDIYIFGCLLIYLLFMFRVGYVMLLIYVFFDVCVGDVFNVICVILEVFYK